MKLWLAVLAGAVCLANAECRLFHSVIVFCAMVSSDFHSSYSTAKLPKRLESNNGTNAPHTPDTTSTSVNKAFNSKLNSLCVNRCMKCVGK